MKTHFAQNTYRNEPVVFFHRFLGTSERQKQLIECEFLNQRRYVQEHRFEAFLLIAKSRNRTILAKNFDQRKLNLLQLYTEKISR